MKEEIARLITEGNTSGFLPDDQGEQVGWELNIGYEIKDYRKIKRLLKEWYLIKQPAEWDNETREAWLNGAMELINNINSIITE